MALAGLENNLQRNMHLRRNLLQRIHNIPRKRVLDSKILSNPTAFLPRPRSVKVDWVDALVRFALFLLLALEAHAFFLVHLWRHAAAAHTATAEHLLHLCHHVGVWLLLRLWL